MAAKLHNISDMTKQFAFFYFNYSTFLSYHAKKRRLDISSNLLFYLYQCMQFLRFYAITAHDTPKAVPTAANIAEARFHRNFIILVLFSLVISPQIFTD